MRKTTEKIFYFNKLLFMSVFCVFLLTPFTLSAIHETYIPEIVDPNIQLKTPGTSLNPGINQATGKPFFVPLEEIPGIDYDVGDQRKFFNSIFTIGVAAAALLAVIMFAVGGIQYMTTELVSSKEDAKDRIVSALSGLFLILLSVILLNIINPDILSLTIGSS